MNNLLANRVTIQTPEGIRFSYPLASPVSRCLAWLLDVFIILTGVSLLQKGLILFQVINHDIARALYILLYFVLSLGYGITLEWLRQGQTLGKKLLHLRVIDADGLKLQGTQVLLRNLLRMVDGLPLFYALGGISSLVHPRNQRLGDIAAGTLVIRTPVLRQPHVETINQGKFNSLRSFPHLCGRLRQRVPQELALVALQALHRCDDLEADARVALFDDIAQTLLSHADFPTEALHGLSSEQIVHNCVELLYETRGL